MCAIVGFAGPVTRTIFRKMLLAAESCGPRSIGLVYADDMHRCIKPWKRAVSARYAIRNHNHRVDAAADSFLAYGHTRWPTHGEVVDKNAHPFEHKSIFFAHNGVVRNYREIKPDAVVDSECLGILIADRNLAVADGSVGLVWMEMVDKDPQMFVYRHSQQLSTITYTSMDDGITTTFVASRLPHIPAQIREGRLVSVNPLEEGVAYRVTSEGPFEAWRNPIKAKVFVRQTIVNGQYVGG